MLNWVLKELRTLRGFLGKQAVILLSMSIIAALATSIVEIAFSILIQSFFIALGILSRDVAVLPSWAPTGFAESAGFVLVFALLRSVLQWFKAFANSLIVECFGVHIRKLISNWTLYFSSWNSSRVVTLSSDRVAVTANSISAFQNIFIQLVTGSFIFIYLFIKSWPLALLGVGMLAALGLLLKSFDSYIRREGNRVAELSSAFNARFLGDLRNLQFLRVCRFEARETRLIASTLNEYLGSNRIYISILALKYAAPQLLGAIIVLMISVVAVEYKLIQGGIFLSFIYLFVRLSQSIAEFSTSASGVRMFYPQLKELYGWYREEFQKHPVVFDSFPIHREGGLPAASWELKKVGVSLSGRRILTGFTAQFPPGKITVLKGPSGVGKSTALAVLAGVLQPNEGDVFFEGEKDSVEVAVKSGKLRFGFVGPEPAIIGGTLADNIQFGLDGPADPLEVARVFELTSCTEFIKNSGGLGHQITDRGEGLSTGQKQRLCLARALLRQPNALLLDEPTANLDEVSKEIIRKALTGLKGKVTIVIATHDEGLAEIADQLIQMSPSES